MTLTKVSDDLILRIELLISAGLTSQQIADKLDIGRSTVRTWALENLDNRANQQLMANNSKHLKTAKNQFNHRPLGWDV